MPGSTSGFKADEHGFEMRRKTSYSLFSKDEGASAARFMPGSKSNGAEAGTKEKLWEIMGSYLLNDNKSIQTSFANHLEYTLACTRYRFTEDQAYRAASYAVRDRLIESFNDTNEFFNEQDTKRGYYLSMEFLIGRIFQNSLVNMNIEPNFRSALADLGICLEEIYELEHDPALGNGGLGRLAACFLDSMATLNLPVWGYGLRYTYGIFEQRIVNGRQYEIPDFWLSNYNPWEIVRPDVSYGVRFYGKSEHLEGDKFAWTGGDVVCAVAYDNLIPGYGTMNCINLRLWKSEPSREFDFQAFNQGRYSDACFEKQLAENLTAVLYPNDNTDEGKELRLKQQYLFVCATLQDILRRFKKKPNRKWEELPDKMAIQLNDTHPSLAIPEMMRLLVDFESLDWHYAWNLVTKVFNYTNHTVLPEALERWPAEMIGRVLPRHMQIINRINQTFLDKVAARWGWDNPAIKKMSIYEEGSTKMIRMANLCVIGCNKVNGVAAIHTEIVKKDVFPEFHAWFAEVSDANKFLNMTNGVTPRRWIYCANRELADLITNWLGNDDWLTDLSKLSALSSFKDNIPFQELWHQVKSDNKRRLAAWVLKVSGVKLNPDSIFDIQVKRIHEYKRQLLNAFYIIHHYISIKGMTDAEKSRVQPRSFLIGGKAAPGYLAAKTIIKLFSNIAQVVNADPDVNHQMKVAFLPNYNVSNAQLIIPAADVTQQISTAGTEASGTGNMKFVMNGGLVVGTMDGANVEIREEAGEETMFTFGLLEHEVDKARAKARSGDYPIDTRLQHVFQMILSGTFSRDDPAAHEEFAGIVKRLTNNGNGICSDHYLICADFASYVEAQEKVVETYKQKKKWLSLSIQACAGSGKFSTDRTIRQYASEIWKLEPCQRPQPSISSTPIVPSATTLK